MPAIERASACCTETRGVYDQTSGEAHGRGAAKPIQPASRLNGHRFRSISSQIREVNRVVNKLQPVARLPRRRISCQGMSHEALGAAGFPGAKVWRDVLYYPTPRMPKTWS